MGAQGTASGPAVACAAPAVPAQAVVLETVRCTVDASFAQEVETLSSQSAEEAIQLEMKAYEERWGCTRATFPMARYLAVRTAGVRRVVTGVAPSMSEGVSLPTESSPPMASADASVVRAPPAKPTAAPAKEGSRLPERSSIKAESVNVTSRTQVAKELCSKAQAKEGRNAGLDRRRSEVGNPAEESDDLSDNGSSK